MNEYIAKSHPEPRAKQAETDLYLLKQECPMPVLMEHIGLGAWAKPSCQSPFRNDKNASWGIFQGEGGWRFKDHGTGESGDEISLLALHLNIDERDNYPLLLNIYAAINRYCDPTHAKPVSKPVQPSSELPDKTEFVKGTEEQIHRLAKLRGISTEGLGGAADSGTLVFGTWHGLEVYGVTDQSGRLLEIRRLDGQVFAAIGDLGERKSHAVKHSDKSWPVGLMEAAKFPGIILTEGGPDFLAAYDLIHQEGKTAEWAAVGLLSANVTIAEDALPHFKGKQVLIFPHADDSGAGTKAAIRWREQLNHAGARAAIFDTSAVKKLSRQVSDLNDFIVYRRTQEAQQHPELHNILT